MLARKLGVSAAYLETGSELDDAAQRELRLGDAELRLRLGDDPAGAETELRSLLDEALQAGDVVAASRAQIGIGLAAFERGGHAEAAERLEAAIAAGVSPADRPDVYATLGRAFSALGTPERAIALFEDCLAQLDDAGERALVGLRTRFATYLSYALADAGDVARAEAVVREAIDAAEDIADPYTQVRLYWALARASSMRDRSSRALTHVRRAIALLEATDDNLHLARAHLLCGSILLLTGDAERARRHLELAERLFGSHADVGDLASLRSEQARLEAQQGNGGLAVERAREALELLGDTDPAEQGVALWGLGEGLGLEGDVEGANDAFRRAADLLDAQGRWRDAAHACRSWGRMLRKAGREQEALDVLERATDYAVRGEVVGTPRRR